MPVIESNYKASGLFKNMHISTIYSGLIRRINGVEQHRERIELPDGDFLDLDFNYAENPNGSIAILLHGLEGHSSRPYILGTAKLFQENGIDCVAVNFRGCSGEANRLYRSYHSGATEDLHAVVQHVASLNKYKRIYIKGISLGANMCLKYLGEDWDFPEELNAAVAVSTPCSLYGSMLELHKWKNKPYAIRFRNHLVSRLNRKLITHPDDISKADISKIKTLKDFDDIYTSKAHGFKDALDYYEQCSSGKFLSKINHPALIINAKNDSFLSPQCFPIEAAKENEDIFLEMPKTGGHVGFVLPGEFYYNELRALEFFNQTT